MVCSEVPVRPAYASMNSSEGNTRRLGRAVAGTLPVVVLAVCGQTEVALAIAIALFWWVIFQKSRGGGELVELAEEVSQKNLELRTRERALVQTVQETEESNSSKDKYLSTISHELRTPLTSIRAYSEMLADFCEDESTELRDDFLRVIMTESERLTRLIDDLLDLAKLEREGDVWEPQKINVNDLLVQCLRSIGGLAIEKMVEFNLAETVGDAVVEGVPDRLQQAFTNVLANAWRFSPPESEIVVRLLRDDHHCTIRVRDHGPGIPEDEFNKVFDRFKQVGSDEDAHRKGTGLGLAITKEIVARHNGSIHCENHPDGGAVFVFKLPCHAAVTVARSSRS